MKVIIDVEEYDDFHYIYNYVKIKKEFCQPLNDNIRLPEEQFTKIIDELNLPIHMLELAKEKGWIIETKTAKEKAEKIAVELEKNRLAHYDIYNVLEMIKYYRKAIKEAEE